jgi:SAM-dependent methyltransferase
VPLLAERYSTITIGGTELGLAHVLERRGRQAGYLGVVGRLLQEVELQPGERVLEVGCGTGVLDRWLARRTAGANQIVGVDINRYLLREGQALVRKEGLEGQVELRQGNARDVPFPDGAFDVVISSTVMEELDADRMMAELVRVTRPGGRVGVIVRAVDMPLLPNFELSDGLKAKAGSARFGGVEEGGCADISLYQRFHQAGLAQVKMFPQYGVVTYADQPYIQLVQGFVLGTLSGDEAAEWRTAVARAQAESTFFIATPYHCAAGTKPQ